MEFFQWFLFFVLLTGLFFGSFIAALSIARRFRKKKLGAVLTLYFHNLTIKGHFMFSMKNGQRIKGSFQPVDDQGQPAKLEPGSVQYATTDEELAVIQRDRDDPDNEHAFEIISKRDYTGPVTVTLSFDGRVGEGVVPVAVDINGEVTSRDAVGGTVNLGEPEDLPVEEEEEVSGEGAEQP